jgi:hypothetical protein
MPFSPCKLGISEQEPCCKETNADSKSSKLLLLTTKAGKAERSAEVTPSWDQIEDWGNFSAWEKSNLLKAAEVRRQIPWIWCRCRGDEALSLLIKRRKVTLKMDIQIFNVWIWSSYKIMCLKFNLQFFPFKCQQFPLQLLNKLAVLVLWSGLWDP